MHNAKLQCKKIVIKKQKNQKYKNKDKKKKNKTTTQSSIRSSIEYAINLLDKDKNDLHYNLPFV